MSELITEDILRDQKTRHPDSITSLCLHHKALSRVSCLSDFKILQRLDLAFNSLTSLKGLELCFNLKWLSVLQNNLHSLKGIEALTNLTVLNAGKNKLRSMDEVQNLVKLRALILNDNDIAIVSGLDQLLELNTLVLSRNPIRKVGNSLAKLKSIAKISLSNCQLEYIDNSFKACTGLEQLRLAHNDIKTLPVELAYIKKLQILDLGDNMISRWTDLEVLSSLHNLKNVNLLGNPIAGKLKLVKKVKKLLPTLQILNSKRMDKLSSEKDQKVEGAVVSIGDELKPSKEKKKVHAVKHWDASPNNIMDVDFDKHVSDDHKLAKDRVHDNNIYHKGKERSGRKSRVIECNADAVNEKEYQLEEKRDRMKKKRNSRSSDISQATEGEPDVAHNLREKKHEKKEKHLKKVLVQEIDETIKDKGTKRKVEKAHLDLIDDKETPFTELVAYDATENIKSNNGQRRDSQIVGKYDAMSALVTYPAKKKKSKNQGVGVSVLQFLTPEIGLGGKSAWTDDDE